MRSESCLGLGLPRVAFLMPLASCYPQVPPVQPPECKMGVQPPNGQIHAQYEGGGFSSYCGVTAHYSPPDQNSGFYWSLMWLSGQDESSSTLVGTQLLSLVLVDSMAGDPLGHHDLTSPINKWMTYKDESLGSCPDGWTTTGSPFAELFVSEWEPQSGPSEYSASGDIVATLICVDDETRQLEFEGAFDAVRFDPS